MLMLGRKQVSPGYFPFKTIESATNCILEIPQNLKLTLENNVLTLKAGSILTLGGDTYATMTTTSDTVSSSSWLANTRYIILRLRSGNFYRTGLTTIKSGDSEHIDTSPGMIYYNTDNKMTYLSGNINTDLSVYPLCLIDVDSNGVASFAKDSNGNDIIFNGFGFVGQTKYILPGVKILLSAGKYNDGTNRNINYTNNSLQLSTSGGTYLRRIFMREGALQITTNAFYYDNSTNLWYDQVDNPINGGCAYLGDCDTFNGVVTNFTINPPLGYWRYFVKMIQ